MEQIGKYAKERGDEVWYFVEAGDSNQYELENIVQQVRNDPVVRDQFALYEFSLLKKGDGIQLQSADLAAWSLAKVEKQECIPGFDNFQDWKAWYMRKHNIGGFTELSAQLQSVVNHIRGLKVVE